MQRGYRWLLLLGAAAVAVFLFVVLRPGGSDDTSAPPTTGVSRGTTTETGATGTEIEITSKGGRPVEGIREAPVKKGENVTLVVRSDVADEVHLHGYDLHKDVEAGGTARIVFIAKITGRFEAELEERKEQILDLSVEP
jgi:hypothetical protein